jgi:hypothetical protein
MKNGIVFSKLCFYYIRGCLIGRKEIDSPGRLKNLRA